MKVLTVVSVGNINSDIDNNITKANKSQFENVAKDNL
jgi:hypothetical protein